MRRTSSLVVAGILLLAVGFAAGKGLADRNARIDMAYASVGAALDQAATIQFSLALLEKQRTAQLQPVLEARLASAIQAAHTAIATYGVPEPFVVPSLTEGIRRSGLYFQQRGIHPEAVKQAEWVVARLKGTPTS